MTYRCSTQDGLTALVEDLDGGEYRITVQAIPGASAQPAVYVNVVLSAEQSPTIINGAAIYPPPIIRVAWPGCVGWRTVNPWTSLLVDANNVARPSAVVAFMVACGIRDSDSAIGCQQL